ncbi:SDR family NAD(P)-dependent oxidoreductase, partial [Mycobacterium tuberculosis]|nr:SDR family NAD(P)-dependent oxidoreductase [Mycobacterium tuberculosis]
MDMLGLTGARVLITAGAAGIGREIAQRFRDAGAEVWVTDIAETAVTAVTAEAGRALSA